MTGAAHHPAMNASAGRLPLLLGGGMAVGISTPPLVKAVSTHELPGLGRGLCLGITSGTVTANLLARRLQHGDLDVRPALDALAALHPDVDWPNGLEGGRVHGHRAVREYWIRQWGLIDPRVEPRGFTTEADGRIAVDVRQVVRDRAGALLKDEMVQHVYRNEDGLDRAMEIRPASRG